MKRDERDRREIVYYELFIPEYLEGSEPIGFERIPSPIGTYLGIHLPEDKRGGEEKEPSPST